MTVYSSLQSALAQEPLLFFKWSWYHYSSYDLRRNTRKIKTLVSLILSSGVF